MEDNFNDPINPDQWKPIELLKYLKRARDKDHEAFLEFKEHQKLEFKSVRDDLAKIKRAEDIHDLQAFKRALQIGGKFVLGLIAVGGFVISLILLIKGFFR